ncbi:MAG: hypothetical protein FJZ01_02320 [Candidatus Sericytochromatia bacterium]|nr:hypothetical protein [Candidatus Tanganyikabacteria bacterium]
MELRINRDWESHRDVRSAATEGNKAVSSASGDGNRGANPPAAVSVEVARRQVEAENQQAAANRVRDPAIAIQLASAIRTQVTARAQDAVRIQTANVTTRSLQALLDAPDPDPTADAGA